MIFEVQDNNPRITPLGLNIPIFTELWKRDPLEEKPVAQFELAYVYHMAHVKSPYNQFIENDRHENIVNDYNRIGWSPDDRVIRAIDTLRNMPPNNTPAVRMLIAAREVADKLAEYFRSVDFTLLDEEGKPVYDAKKTVDTLRAMGGVISTLEELEESVRQGVSQMDEKVRGGAKFSILEDEI